MKHSDSIKTMLPVTIKEAASDPHKYAVNLGKDFTRNQKMKFHDTIMMQSFFMVRCIIMVS